MIGLIEKSWMNVVVACSLGLAIGCSSANDSGLSVGSSLPDGGLLRGTGGAPLFGDGGGLSFGGVGGSVAGGGVSGGAPCAGPTCASATGPGSPPGTACTDPGARASGRCEPKTGTTQEVCLGACFADGAPCARALDCCSTGCMAGKCGGLCTLEGDACTNSGECCSNICQGGRCSIDHANPDCRPTGEDCSSGEGSGCCNACDKETKRCGFGADTCFAQGVACKANADCCRGTCTAGVCKTPCVATGAACTAGADCCTGTCSSAAVCALPPPPPGSPACLLVGDQCTTGAECGTANCFGGFCEILQQIR